MASTDLSADTRARILEAAWTRVGEGGAGAASVKDIAAAAGVSRQLVYFHYGSRAGLLVAMARHRDEVSGFRSRALATRSLSPVEALETLLREWCDYLPVLLPVARALEAALVAGDEGGAAWRDRMGELRAALGHGVGRVAAEGALAAGWTVETAADWIWSRVQPSTYAHLVEECGWAASDYASRTVDSVLKEILAPS